jgi:hypothetical protein
MQLRPFTSRPPCSRSTFSTAAHASPKQISPEQPAWAGGAVTNSPPDARTRLSRIFAALRKISPFSSRDSSGLASTSDGIIPSLLLAGAVVPERIVSLPYRFSDSDLLRPFDEVQAFLSVPCYPVEQ